MAKPIYENLNADGMSLTIFCGGMSNIGIRLFGTWAGTATFYQSFNGISFVPVNVTPFASGTTVGSSTANGNWFLPVGDAVAFRVTFTRTSGTLGVALAAAVDSSWQDAFLTASTLWVNTEGTGTTTQTQAAQANRAWNLQECHVSLSGPMTGAGAVSVVVFDGDITGTILHKEFLNTSVGSVGASFTVGLPSQNISGIPGVIGTPGNAMTVVVRGPTSGITVEINSKYSAA